MKLLTMTLLAIVTVVSIGNQEREQVDMQLGKDYPKATKDTERFVIRLPKLSPKLEELSKVEITVGKTIKTDGINTYEFLVHPLPVPINGEDVSYFDLVGDSFFVTQMKGSAETKPVFKFVTAKPFMVKYRSEKPLVIYVSKGMEVRYRVYQAHKEKSAKKG